MRIPSGAARKGAIAALMLAALTASDASQALAAPTAGKSIVGGDKANAKDWQFTVALREKGRGFFCTGSLVSPSRVLTAAHCVKHAKVRKLRVVTGTPWASGERAHPVIRVGKVKVDPDYNGRLDRQDVAVLNLNSPSPAEPIELPTTRQSAAALQPRSKVQSAGWGARSPWGFRLAKRLKSTRERVLSNRRCQRYYGKTGFSSPSMICVLGKYAPSLDSYFRLGTTSCSGDSGGPLVAKTPSGPRLVGVVSAGPIPCGIGPSIYARVTGELKFIRRALGPTAP